MCIVLIVCQVLFQTCTVLTHFIHVTTLAGQIGITIIPIFKTEVLKVQVTFPSSTQLVMELGFEGRPFSSQVHDLDLS